MTTKISESQAAALIWGAVARTIPCGERMNGDSHFVVEIEGQGFQVSVLRHRLPSEGAVVCAYDGRGRLVDTIVELDCGRCNLAFTPATADHRCGGWCEECGRCGGCGRDFKERLR